MPLHAPGDCMKTFVIPYTHYQIDTISDLFSQTEGPRFTTQTVYALVNQDNSELYSDSTIPSDIASEYFTSAISKDELSFPSEGTRLLLYKLTSCDFFRLSETLSNLPGLTPKAVNMFSNHRCTTPVAGCSSETQNQLARTAAGEFLTRICNKFTNETFRTPLWIDYDLLTGDPKNVEQVNLIANTHAVFVAYNTSAGVRELKELLHELFNVGYNISGAIRFDVVGPLFDHVYKRFNKTNYKIVYVTSCIHNLLSLNIINHEIINDCGSPLSWRFCVSTCNSVWDSPEFNNLANVDDDIEPSFIVNNLSEVHRILQYFTNDFESHDEYPKWIKENHHVCHWRG